MKLIRKIVSVAMIIFLLGGCTSQSNNPIEEETPEIKQEDTNQEANSQTQNPEVQSQSQLVDINFIESAWQEVPGEDIQNVIFTYKVPTGWYHDIEYGLYTFTGGQISLPVFLYNKNRHSL